MKVYRPNGKGIILALKGPLKNLH